MRLPKPKCSLHGKLTRVLTFENAVLCVMQPCVGGSCLDCQLHLLMLVCLGGALRWLSWHRTPWGVGGGGGGGGRGFYRVGAGEWEH